jgi:hypothetical protein
MEGHSLSGLVELLFVVGLLFWLWSSQRSALRKDPGTDRGAGSHSAAESTKEREPPP